MQYWYFIQLSTRKPEQNNVYHSNHLPKSACIASLRGKEAQYHSRVYPVTSLPLEFMTNRLNGLLAQYPFSITYKQGAKHI